jgi:DNA-binding MarR family transcriptional regulator
MAAMTRAGQQRSDGRARDRYDDVAWVAYHVQRLGLGDPTGIELMASVARTSRLMTSGIEQALKSYSLSYSQYLLLMTVLLSDEGERTLSQISRHMLVHPTTVTILVDQLEKKGLVRRHPDPTDRRVTLARLTPAGKSLAKESTVTLINVNFGLPKLTKQKTRQLLDILAELRFGAGDVPPRANPGS